MLLSHSGLARHGLLTVLFYSVLCSCCVGVGALGALVAHGTPILAL